MIQSERSHQSAISGILLPVLGALILLVGVGVAALTEKAQIAYQTDVQRHGGDVLDLGTDARPGAGQQGYMVRVVGPLEVVESPRDAQFNQQCSSPLLIRHVQMFEWSEKRYGGPAQYEMDWEDQPIDASRFEHPAGHANPGSFPIDDAQFDSGQVRVDGFVLSPQLVHALPGSAPIDPDMRRLPVNLAASFSLYNQALLTSSNPSNPQLGDIRVSWEAVPLETVTIVAKLDGHQLVPATDAADGAGYALQVGDSPLGDIFPDLPEAPEFMWARRVISILLGAVGVTLLMRWHHARIDIALMAGTILLVVGALDAVLWLGHDNAIAAAWFGLALVGIALAAWRMHARGVAKHAGDHAD